MRPSPVFPVSMFVFIFLRRYPGRCFKVGDTITAGDFIQAKYVNIAIFYTYLLLILQILAYTIGK